MNLAEIIGVAAAILTTSAFVPQAAKVVRTRETSAISLTMYSLFTLGVTLWLAYGLMTSQWTIICDNAITLVFAAVILVMKLGEGARLRRNARRH